MINRLFRIHPLSFCVIAAACLAALTSLRGVDYDQMIFYEAGLRQLYGQLPYRDFHPPHGPVAGMVFSFFLATLPTGGFAILISSMVLNVLATFLAWRILSNNGLVRKYCLAAALMTAVWFLPPFGAFYNDHLAYLFVLLAAWCFFRPGTKPLHSVLTGVFFALAFHTKQTVGGPALIAFVVSLLARRPDNLRGHAKGFAIGSTIVHALFFLYLLWIPDGVHSYYIHSILYPVGFTEARHLSFWNLLKILVMPLQIEPITMIREHGWGRLLLYPVVLCIYFSYAVAFKNRKESQFPITLFLFLLLSTLLGSALVNRYAAHLFFGTGIVIAIMISSLRKTPFWIPNTLTFLICLIGIAHLERFRVFNYGFLDDYKKTDLYPVKVQGDVFSQENAKLVNYLRDKPGPIAVVGRWPYLISAALRRPASNPVLYYEKSLTVPDKPSLRTEWTREMLEALDKNAVEFVVVENTAAPVLFEGMELFNTYLQENFKQVLRLHRCFIFERKHQSLLGQFSR